MASYLVRSLEPVLRRAASQFPAIVLTGPRQSGKTTLLRHVFGDRARFVSLETPDIRAAAIADPRALMELYPPPVIFDEVQNVPELLPYIKDRIDARRSKSGQFFLTGSQDLLLTDQITESLAGRAAVLHLLPLSQREIQAVPSKPLPWETARTSANSNPGRKDLWTGLLRGGYPELVSGRNRDWDLWLASYLRTYLERDVRSLRQVGDLTSFQHFLRVLAARSGQLLNLTDVSRDLGVAVNTAKAWLSVLEATFQVMVLRPYFENAGKRLVKTPKIYFTDTGMLCHLTGLKDPMHAAAGPMGGPIFETAVLMEIVKTYLHRGEVPQVYFWRTATGNEVDIVIADGGRLIPVEVKLSATPRISMAASLAVFREDFKKKVAPGYVIYTGKEKLPLAPGVMALPFAGL